MQDNSFSLAKVKFYFQGIHCIIDVNVPVLERLHKHQIYPIVLFIKFKSFKQIKEVKDTRFPADKISAKAAKEMYEHGLKVENEFRNYISGKLVIKLIYMHFCMALRQLLWQNRLQQSGTVKTL